MSEMDLNKMSLEEIIEYCQEREKFLLQMLINIDGFEKTCEILADNSKI